jgi:co-chaperonin GroES (HSP10)
LIRPLRDILVLRVLPQERTKVGGLYMPETGDAAFANTIRCEVLAAGPGMLRDVNQRTARLTKPKQAFIPTTAKVGDTVLVKSYDGKPAGEKIENPDDPAETLVLIRERDISGILVPA